MKRTRLTKLRVNEVSVVDTPANKQAEILIAKRHDGAADHPTNSNMEDADMTLEELSKKLEEAEAAVAALTKRAEAAEANATALTKRAEDAEAAVKKAAEDAAAGDQGDDAILKSLDPKVRDYVESVKKQADAANAAIAKAADERLTAEYIAKAAKFDGLPGVTPDAFGPVLKRVLGSADEGDRDAVLSALAKASDAAKKSLTTALGESGRFEKSDAEAELEAKAHEVAKRDGVPFAKAYAKAMHENPELYTRFLAKN